jgi:hypothetical protein
MTESYTEEIRETFRELEHINDDELRENVVRAWDKAMVESKFTSLDEIPRGSDPESVGPQKLVPHIRDATACAMSIADILEEIHTHDLDRDVIVAGALLHDISKLYEQSDDEFKKQLPHPAYAIHVLADCDLSTHIQHIVYAHTPLSRVRPQTFEGRIVQVGDLVSMDSLWWSEGGPAKWHERKDTL